MLTVASDGGSERERGGMDGKPGVSDGVAEAPYYQGRMNVFIQQENEKQVIKVAENMQFFWDSFATANLNGYNLNFDLGVALGRTVCSQHCYLRFELL